eukprot:scaffold1950_cov75-Cyclotella_meneghiniana.AAC.1
MVSLNHFRLQTASDNLFKYARDICIEDVSVDRPESELLFELETILKANPDIVHEKDDRGHILLHFAASHRSPVFCQLLMKANPHLVKTTDAYGWLPFHFSCYQANIETAKYLYQLYPESINIPDNSGCYPLHDLLRRELLGSNYSYRKNQEHVLDMIQFLLQNDQGAVSTCDGLGSLPLHCASQCTLAIAKLVFNSYPQAIYSRDHDAETPVDIARRFPMMEVVTFLESQIELEHQAREDRAPDNNGQLLIHRAIHNGDASIGAIKLMLAAYPAGTVVPDNQGRNILHAACQAGNLDAVKYLIEIPQDLLKAIDTRGNLPLHIACRVGNCVTIPFIIENSTYGVCLQNSDKLTPLEVLLFQSECDRSSIEYVEAIRCLIQVDPEFTLKRVVKKDNIATVDEKQGAGRKRKRTKT